MPPTTARLFANAFASCQSGSLGREPLRPNPAKPPRPPASQPRRGLRRGDAAAYVGVSPSKFDQMIADGRMPKPIKMDACAVWDIRRLDEAFEDLMTAEKNPWDSAIDSLQARQGTPGPLS
jgi:predicted DNA-binding transcriptional regulator AlpA